MKFLPRAIKVPWFFAATWCFPVVNFLFLNNFLSSNPLLGNHFFTVWAFLSVFLWISIVAIIIDLWFSDVERDKKWLWTVLLLVVYPFVAPAYWVIYVLKIPRLLPGAIALYALMFLASIAYIFLIFLMPPPVEDLDSTSLLQDTVLWLCHLQQAVGNLIS